jgi:putative peptidoglycan lipid II flippase
MSIVGKPLIHILFQHGAFTGHASALTALVLIGYAVGLPGRVASELLMRSFYGLKNALIPLLTNIVAFAAHVGLILFLLKGNNWQRRDPGNPIGWCGRGNV